jgi:hypothetical protein
VDVYTRLVNPPCEQIEEIFEKLERCGIPRESLNIIDHNDCSFCIEDVDDEFQKK